MNNNHQYICLKNLKNYFRVVGNKRIFFPYTQSIIMNLLNDTCFMIPLFIHVTIGVVIYTFGALNIVMEHIGKI